MHCVLLHYKQTRLVLESSAEEHDEDFKRLYKIACTAALGRSCSREDALFLKEHSRKLWAKVGTLERLVLRHAGRAFRKKLIPDKSLEAVAQNSLGDPWPDPASGALWCLDYSLYSKTANTPSRITKKRWKAPVPAPAPLLAKAKPLTKEEWNALCDSIARMKS